MYVPFAMFPAKEDRYWIIRILVEHARRGRTLKEVEAASGVSKTSISHAGNIVKKETLADGSQEHHYEYVGRDILFRMLADGLGVSPERARAVASLLDGKTSKDRRKLDKELEPHERLEREGQRKILIQMLQETLPVGVIASRNAKITLARDSHSRLLGLEELRRCEENLGQRMLITRFPSTLVYPREIIESDSYALAEYPEIEDELRDEARRTDLQRSKRFFEHLERFGERSIHSSYSIRKFLNEHPVRMLPRRQRQSIVEGWISLIGKHDHYEVRLVPRTPELDIAIKGIHAAVARPTPRSQERSESETTRLWGPRHFFWYDQTAVLALVLDFERSWDRVDPRYKNKEKVMKYLRDELDKSTRRSSKKAHA